MRYVSAVIDDPATVLHLGEILLLVSTLIQAGAVVQAVRLAVQARRMGWLFLALANFLIFGRRVFVFIEVFSQRRAAVPGADFIALVISLLMVVGLTLLLSRARSSAGFEGAPAPLQNAARLQLRRHAIVLAVLALLGCAGLAYFAYSASREAVTNRLLNGSLELAHILATPPGGAPDPPAALANMERLWAGARSQRGDNYLCVIGADGRLIFNSRRPEKVGGFVGGTKIPAGKGAPGTVQELVAARRDWVGRNRNSEGEPQIAAYAYSPALNALVAVHLPARSVDAEIRSAALPWGAGIALIFAVILPASFGLLYSASSASEKSAVEALRQRLEVERRYSLLIENLRDHAILMLDAEGRVTAWNPGADSLRGWTKAEMKDRPFASFYPSEEASEKKPERDLESAAREGRRELEGWRLRADGTRFWASVTISAVRQTGGEPSCYVVVTRDITERRQAEELRWRSDALLRSVVDTSPHVLFVKDADSRILLANEVFARFYGLNTDEVVGRLQSELHATQGSLPSEIEAWLADDARVIASRQAFETEETGTDTEGRIHYFQTGKYPLELHDGRPGVLVISQDITAHKQAEMALRASEAKLAAAQEQAQVGSWDLDPAAGRGTWSREMFRLFERDPALPPPPFEEFVAAIHPDDRAAVTKHHGQIMHHGGHAAFEFRLNPAIGREKWFAATVTAESDEEGGTILLSGTAQDITERIRAQNAVRLLSHRLLRAEDEERRRIAKELHDSTAQDLVAVMMNLELLQDEIGAGATKNGEYIADSIALLENSVNDIRTLSYVVHPPQLDEAGLAGALTEYAAGFSRRSDIRVQVKIDPEFARMPADVELTLFRVVQESLANIFRHAESDTATIHLARRDGGVVLEVTDRGRGFSVAMANADPGALGVGIVGMRERMDHIGGRIDLESSSRGTTVRAILPQPEIHP